LTWFTARGYLKPMLHTVILAGGRGERFWPLSRHDRPKQLLALNGQRTMLEETIERVIDLVPLERTYVVTGGHLAGPVLDTLPGLAEEHLLAEPCGRNTCMAIGLAAAEIGRKDPEGVMLVLSADHRIEPAERLRAILGFGAELALTEQVLVTIGITPSRAETGYGYIEVAETLRSQGDLVAFRVAGFKEKPEPRQAQIYYYGRKHLWNAGMFVWSVPAIWKALAQHCPVHFAALERCRKSPGDGDVRKASYDAVPDISIDFAVLEKADNVVTIKADLVWDDVGSWLALDRMRERDHDGNVRAGTVIAVDSTESVIYNDAEGLIATLGVSDLIVVRSGRVTFVAHKSRVNQIRNLVQQVQSEYPDLV
jgi:mannose-1-phosphate guanylyltransferase